MINFAPPGWRGAGAPGVNMSRRRTRVAYRLRELVSLRFMDHLERAVLAADELATLVDRVAAREIDPYTAANDLLKRAGLKASPIKT